MDETQDLYQAKFFNVNLDQSVERKLKKWEYLYRTCWAIPRIEPLPESCATETSITWNSPRGPEQEYQITKLGLTFYEYIIPSYHSCEE